MRLWAQWCIDHNLRWLLYVVAVTLLPVVGVIYLWGKAFPEVLDDTLHSLRAIGKQRKTGAKA